jgi:UDP-N-acetylmuramoyl-tripeptide--D-alanyl-D-alanine ligase
MIAMTLAEIAEVTGGTVDGDPTVVVSAPASLDSRAVPAGGLFVAVVGERVDGHEYAEGAVASGAAAVLGSRPVGVPAVVVTDPAVALGKLAAHVRNALTDTTVVALTGSQGKTGTKDYLAQLLAAAGPTVATLGNLNNEYGVPLTVLRATPETRYLVVEMGARGIGHIAYLCDIARPSVAGVLNVGTAHVGEFGSREAIAVAKGEILEGLPADGVAVVNADDPLTREMDARTDARVISFGRGGDVSWSDETVDDLDRPTAVFHYAGEKAQATLRQPGAHQLANAAAAVALAVGAGMPFADAVAALADAESLSQWRMELHEGPDGIVLVNDSYNANPASMRAAVDVLTTIGERRGARTVAVLGEMKELGAESEEAHRTIGEYAASRHVDVLLAIGEPTRPMVEGTADSPTTGVYVPDRDAALAWLRSNIGPGDIVVVKASRGAQLDKLAAAVVDSWVEESR